MHRSPQRTAPICSTCRQYYPQAPRPCGSPLHPTQCCQPCSSSSSSSSRGSRGCCRSVTRHLYQSQQAVDQALCIRLSLTVVTSIPAHLTKLRYCACCLGVPCHAMPCYAMPCYAMLCHAMPCYAMPCYAMPCHAMPCYAMLCHALLVCW
jgi:hypothetical protein